jgi:hypothetical protein
MATSLCWGFLKSTVSKEAVEMKLEDMNTDKRPITDPEEFYQEVVVPSGLFEQARELFPRYNNRQSLQASDWIMTSLEDGRDLANDPNWAEIRDEVYDMVVAGLT